MKKYQIYFYTIFALSFLLSVVTTSVFAQKDSSIDNGYYITYSNKLALRVFLSQKFAPFTISTSNSDEELNYKTNSKLNLGAGVTYRSVTLNLSYGFNFLNTDKGQGKTKGLDFQFHIYPHKWAIDILGTFLKGYYLDPKDNNGLHLSDYYQRQDIKRDVVGISAFRVPNANKFSYRAAFTQNDWQTKSAGTLLYGGEAYYGTIKGDSVLVPNNVSTTYEQAGIDKVNFFNIGPGVGYAYTLVIDKNFFITGSAVVSADVNFSSEDKNNNSETKVSLLPGGVYKGAIGYNSSTWSVSANITGNILYSGSPASPKDYFLPSGNFRFIVAKKIGTKAH